MRNFAMGIAFMTTLVSMVLLFWHLPQLPDTVATHFGNGGKPDGFMSKSAYAVMMTLIFIGIPAFIATMGVITKWLPDQFINVPNKAYWLHPDRRAESLQKGETFCWWMSAATSVFLLILNEMTVSANLEKRGLIESHVMILLAVYLVLTGVAVFWLYRQFPHVPGAEKNIR
jgi:uncharacterized membrane protein